MALEGETSKLLKEEFEHYIAHQDEYVEQYDGKVIVLKDGKVLGVYDDDLDAVSETKKLHELGTFLVQRVSKGDAAYSQQYHSRAVFS